MNEKTYEDLKNNENSKTERIKNQKILTFNINNNIIILSSRIHVTSRLNLRVH
jgi:hypothetical protein